jgi:hypothetical protein
LVEQLPVFVYRGAVADRRLAYASPQIEPLLGITPVHVLAKAQGVPANALRKWLVSDPEWHQQYTKARLLQGQAMAEEAIHVARETTNHSSAADRLLIETLKWAASKANPQEFGDKQTVEHQGAQTLQIKVVEDDAPPRLRRSRLAYEILWGTRIAADVVILTRTRFESAAGVATSLPATVLVKGGCSMSPDLALVAETRAWFEQSGAGHCCGGSTR